MTAQERTIGLPGATGIGVGAIVGGGILALAGVAFATTGPSAILAFGINGIIALVTALSFAELATRFPESGGTYSFAKKVLSIETAFMVGWIVWFASIVAAALYAFGFGAFVVFAVETVWASRAGAAPGWLDNRWAVTVLAIAATGGFMVALLRTTVGGGKWLNIGKVVVFGILVTVGLAVLVGEPAGGIREQLTPFFAKGAFGLILAMGFTFIALQGFDLIAAVGGEIREPRRTIPRAMLLSLGIALAIYLPLLLVVATVGVPEGQSVREIAVAEPEAIVAVAAQNYMGAFGYWLVIVAGVLSMLSALQANLLAASRVALAMARDRTLPHWLETVGERSIPSAAILATAAVIVAVLLVVPDVGAIGAAASLVFLITFSLAQGIAVMARRRSPDSDVFLVPGAPLVPLAGGSACIGLAIFEGVAVPSAGLIVAAWLAAGGILYLSVFARRARSVDAYSQALNADLVRLRGHSPLVLVPVTNPANAEAMVGVANAMAPPVVGRVLLLTIISPPGRADGPPDSSLENVQSVMSAAISASFARSLSPEMLTTVAPSPWPEIMRVARTHRCESLLLGFNRIVDPKAGSGLERLLTDVGSEVVILRAPPGWLLRDVRRVLVPIAGRGVHDVLRARLLGSIHRLGAREITLLRVLPEHASERAYEHARTALTRIARDEVPHGANIVVMRSDELTAAITQHAEDSDLIVLGARRTGKHKSFGAIALGVADNTSCAIVLMSRRG